VYDEGKIRKNNIGIPRALTTLSTREQVRGEIDP
jgi:hypothetical protein